MFSVNKNKGLVEKGLLCSNISPSLCEKGYCFLVFLSLSLVINFCLNEKTVQQILHKACPSPLKFSVIKGNSFLYNGAIFLSLGQTLHMSIRTKKLYSNSSSLPHHMHVSKCCMVLRVEAVDFKGQGPKKKMFKSRKIPEKYDTRRTKREREPLKV